MIRKSPPKMSEWKMGKLPKPYASHLVELRTSFGRDYWVLLAWVIGCKMPLRWNDKMKKWVDDDLWK